MRPTKPLTLLVALPLTLAACRPAPPPPTPASAATPADLPVIARDALAPVHHPAAAVAISLPDRALLARAEVHGADAATLALRPGSTLKPLLAAAAVDRGVPLETFTCERAYRGLHCFDAHGPLDVEHAIAVSCNTYFYDVAHRLGPADAMSALRSFGLGAPPGLAAKESAGFVPAWTGAEDDLDQRAMATATGHGMLRVTLLQLASAYATLAGKLTTPAADPARAAGFARVRAGLRDVLEKPYGTAHRVAIPGLAIAGKTGTAEPGEGPGSTPEGAPSNGWFVAYAPADAPQILVAVLVVGGGSGSDVAAPVAVEILRRWSAPRGSLQPAPAQP